MKARQVEQRLQEKLPLFTNKFTREQAISSIFAVGTTATATTPAAHGLTVGKKVLVVGVNSPVAIDTITRAGGMATVVTSEDHDLTEGFFDKVNMSGSNEPEFNGSFVLLSVPNRRTYTISIDDSGPAAATGSPQLDDPGIPFGYNGLRTVTAVPTPDTFSFELSKPLALPGNGGAMRVIKGVRIHSAISFDRARAVFESKDIDNDMAVAVVVLGDVTANKDRSSLNDGVSSSGVSGDNRQRYYQSLTVVIFQKVTDETSSVDAMDDAQDLSRHVISSLAGWSPGDGFAVQSGHSLKFMGHGVLLYDTAIYAHGVDFQVAGDISNEDLETTPANVAFRDIAFSFTNSAGGQLISATVDLDDDPLEA